MLPTVMAFPHADPESDSARDAKGEERSADRPSDGDAGDRSGDRPDEPGVRDDRGVSDDKERWRLAWHYADMTDGELESLAAESGSLTEVALRALQSELRRRSLPVQLAEPAVAAATAATTADPKRLRKLVTVCRFRDMPQALLAKSVLESAGIECLLADANIIRTDWLWSNLVGGVKLRVLEEDLDEALRILDQNPEESSTPSGGEDFQPPRCPRCQSRDVALDDLPDSDSEAAVSSTAGPHDDDLVWTCQSCGNQWRELEPTG
jgi:hypothetical protein